MPSTVDSRVPGYSIAEIVTKHDTNAQGTLATRLSDAIYVGGTGNMEVVINGSNVLFSAIPTGAILPIAVSRIRATNTTATLMIALFY